MKIINVLLIISFLVGLTNFSVAQKNPRIKKKEFKVLDADFKDAWKSVKKGNRAFRQNKSGSYRIALDNFNTAYEYNSDHAALNYKLGISCLFHAKKSRGMELLESAYDLNPNVASDIHFWLGRAYHLNLKFDKAKEEYEMYLASLSKGKQKRMSAKINKLIAECENGKELVKNPVRVLIDNLGSGVNSRYDEYSPVFASFDSIVLFTSRRDDTQGGRRSSVSNEYFEDIYYTSALNGVWQPSTKYGKPINKKGNDAVVAISTNGFQMLIYRGKKKNGNIYKSEYKFGSERWSKPKRIIKKINKKRSKESTLTFDRDSNTIYFVSTRKGGSGNRDIWITKKRPNSNSGWSKAKNMGAPINTPYNEEAVYLSFNDSVLYFSSQGHNSMGGYDIFKSYLLPDGRWSEPVNMGYPINTPDDDLFFSISENGRTGYYAADKDDGQGGLDLYSFVLLGPERKLKGDNEDQLLVYFIAPVSETKMEGMAAIKTMRMTILKGTVADYETNNPIGATIEVIDNQTNETLQSIATNPTTGEFNVPLPSGKNYGIAVSANGYMFHSENFIIPEASQYQEIIKDIKLVPIDPGSKIVLKNVFFDTGKATLRPESYPELNRLAGYFKVYPTLVVEISGHTDNKGSKASNTKLSKARAQAVVDYMVNTAGVPAKNLISVGYADSQPVATNKTEEGRQANRRVEAKIISK